MAFIILLLGSNIEPTRNIPKALRVMHILFEVEAISTPWETPAVGAEGPNFINIAVRIQTTTSPDQLKGECLRRLESHMGRVRTSNKNAPRTMDVDVIIMNESVLDPALWSQAHIAIPIAELLPNLLNPETGLTLAQTANCLRISTPVIPRGDLFYLKTGVGD